MRRVIQAWLCARTRFHGPEHFEVRNDDPEGQGLQYGVWVCESCGREKLF